MLIAYTNICSQKGKFYNIMFISQQVNYLNATNKEFNNNNVALALIPAVHFNKLETCCLGPSSFPIETRQDLLCVRNFYTYLNVRQDFFSGLKNITFDNTEIYSQSCLVDLYFINQSVIMLHFIYFSILRGKNKLILFIKKIIICFYFRR